MQTNNKDQLICNHCDALATTRDDVYWPYVAVCCDNSDCIELAKDELFNEAMRMVQTED